MKKSRGYTLIELLVTTAVAGFAIAGMTGVFLSQQKSYTNLDGARQAQDSSRTALGFIEDKVVLAGYGIDPAFAFDFGFYRCATAGDPAGCNRDRADGPDELVFYARNPNYFVNVNPAVVAGPAGNAWTVGSGTTPTDLHLDARTEQVFRAGQVIQVVCRAGLTWGMVTVRSDSPSSGGDTTIALMAARAGDPYRQNGVLTSGCITGGAAMAFLVDRYRFWIEQVGEEEDLSSYLMLDQGFDLDGDGQFGTAGDSLPVAKDIEDLQVAYVMNKLSPVACPGSIPEVQEDSNTDSVFGNELGEAEQVLSTTVNLIDQSTCNNWPAGHTYKGCLTDVRYCSPLRTRRHPGNIRAVRVGIIGRTAHLDPARRDHLGALPPLENRGPVTLTDKYDYTGDSAYPVSVRGYDRMVLRTTVAAQNMRSRAIFMF